MKLIVGLGNPTDKYKGTRHNIGFMAIDFMAKTYNIEVETRKFQAYIGKGVIGGQKVILAKPLTFMNLSGESVHAIADYFKIEAEDIIVVYDDTSLDVGRLRIRRKGSAGGHNGIKNIISHLGTMEFPRIKIGIGQKKPGMDLADYVLGHFTKSELTVLEDSLKDACDAAGLMIEDKMDEAMNVYNKNKE